jgi:hypothetical protein
MASDQRAFERGLFAHADLAAVELRAVTARGGEQLLAHHVEHHGVFQAALDLAGDRHRETREAVHEIRGAIERVDDPQHVALAGLAAFLGQKRVVGMQAPDGFDDIGLGSPIHLGDVVIAALAVDLDGFEPRHGTYDDVAGAARGFDRNIE